MGRLTGEGLDHSKASFCVAQSIERVGFGVGFTGQKRIVNLNYVQKLPCI
jgi:hypothetical protein